jgi:Tfp pilus assembly protein PilN
MPMIEINLLPQELRRKSGGFGVPKATRFGIVAAVVFVGVIVGLTYMQRTKLAVITSDIARVEAKAQRMQKDIELVDRLVDVKTRIVRRLTAIETLDRNRAAWVQNMEDLATVIPEFLWLSSFQQGDANAGVRQRNRRALAANQQPLNADSIAAVQRKLTLQGFCYTVSSLANFITNLQDSPRFSDIRLQYAHGTKLNERHVYDFQVMCQLEPIDADAKGFEDVPAGTQPMSEAVPNDDELPEMASSDEDVLPEQ